MFGLGPTELIVIAVIVLLLFGAKRLPEIGKGMGGAIRELKAVKKELNSPAGDDETETKAGKGGRKEGADDLEAKVVDKVLDQVPGVKQAKAAKEKADKIKEIIG